jgi:aryl-alcohol dehydrogenase-like predicted oxidoreductase
MRQRPLGSSGLQVSVVGLGCNAFGWKLDERQTRAVVEAALDAGITFFDTAETYGEGDSERFLGRLLAGRRDQVVIGTKFGWGRGFGDDTVARGSPAYIRGAIDESLRRLATDYVDLYQYHRPDGVTPIAETLGALDELRSAGKVRAIGSSQMTASQVREADRVGAELGLARFASAQNLYNLIDRSAEEELVGVCEELELGLIPFYPLARGLLTGKYRRGEPAPPGSRLEGGPEIAEQDWERLGALEAFAARYGVGILEVSIGGLAAQPAVASVIAGATRPEQALANAAAGAWEPTPEELAELRSL